MPIQAPKPIVPVSTRVLEARRIEEDRYREREEIEEWRQKDPIARFEGYLLEHGVLDEAERDEISERIKAEVAEASQYAENAPFADPDDALIRVYAEA